MKGAILRSLAAALLPLSLVICVPSVQAQAYPSRPLRFIVPFPPGGVTDRMARLLSQRMTESWSQPVVVENRPGGSGIIACQAVTAICALISAPAGLLTRTETCSGPSFVPRISRLSFWACGVDPY